MNELQDAVYHGPGRYCAIVVYTLDGADEDQAKRALCRVARLMAMRTAHPAWHRNFHVLVGVSIALLNHAGVATSPFSGFPANMLDASGQPGDGQGDVVVQIAADTSIDRVRALDLVHEVLARGHDDGQPALELKRRFELLGEPRPDLTEPFGYRDGEPSLLERIPKVVRDRLVAEVGKPAPTGQDTETTVLLERLAHADVLPESNDERLALHAARHAEIQARCADAEGGTWLLFQRYVHDIDQFMTLDGVAQDQVMGKQRRSMDGLSPLPPTSHLAEMKQHATALQRRSFAFRANGEDGLAFVALAKSLDALTGALTTMAAGTLMKYLRVEAGGVYRVPPSVEWITSRVGRDVGPVSLPPRATRHLGAASDALGLVDYALVPEVLEYVMFARSRGLFLEPTMLLHPDVEALVSAIEALLAGATVTVTVDRTGQQYDRAFEDMIKGLRTRIRETSEKHYRRHGRYLTIAI
jgi:deferrochelatase/peroxidase EfeB